MSGERLSNLPKGFKQKRMTVKSSDPEPFHYIAGRLCASCRQPLGLDRPFVQHYKFYHLDCWQAKFPDRAAADKKTRGETN